MTRNTNLTPNTRKALEALTSAVGPVRRTRNAAVHQGDMPDVSAGLPKEVNMLWLIDDSDLGMDRLSAWDRQLASVSRTAAAKQCASKMDKTTQSAVAAVAQIFSSLQPVYVLRRESLCPPAASARPMRAKS